MSYPSQQYAGDYTSALPFNAALLDPAMAELLENPPMIVRGYWSKKQQVARSQENGTFAALPQSEQVMEAGAAASFNQYLQIKIIRILQTAFRAVPTDAYRTVTRVRAVPDFRPTQITRIAGMGGLLERIEGNEYKDTVLSIVQGALTSISTYGRMFSLPMEVFYNDDLGLLNLIPDEFGRQAGFMRNRIAIQAAIANNPTLYDGRAFFNNVDGNLGSTVLSANIAGANAVVAGWNAAITTMKDDQGRQLGYMPRYLLVPTALRVVAEYLMTSPVVDNGSGVPVPNLASRLGLTVVVEPSLQDVDDWFILCDPNEFAHVFTDFLRGQEEPIVFRVASSALAINSGAEDLFNIINDDYRFKCRISMGATPIDRRGSFGSLVS